MPTDADTRRKAARVSIGFQTKDKVELTKQSIEPLLAADCDVFWSDGSDTREGQELPFKYVTGNGKTHVISNVGGGADAAIVHALTVQLNHHNNYDYVGLLENDVLLTDSDWLPRSMELFEQGRRDDLEVGSATPRVYEDRILVQRDDYAILHNAGAGVAIFTRAAAELVLQYFRTGWTHANRLLFSQLSGVDIGGYWAFRGAQHALGADWSFDAHLAAHGLASLGLNSSPVRMIGQVPPLHEQGLTIAAAPVEMRRNEQAFDTYRARLRKIREDLWQPARPGLFHWDGRQYTIYPHQLHYIGGGHEGNWDWRWLMGIGPFILRAGFPIGEDFDDAKIYFPVLGPCELLLSGGKNGGQVRVADAASGFECTPHMAPEGDQGQVMSIPIPSAVSYREIEITAMNEGVCFFGVRCHEAQPYYHDLQFDYSWLQT